MNKLFTPRSENGERLSFPAEKVKVLSGSIDHRGAGIKAIIEIDGKRYKVRGAACGLPRCMCDAVLVPYPRKGEET
jgi:hypothetical protein